MIVTALVRQASAQPAPASSADMPDLSSLGQLAVYSDGRLKSFESFARSMMRLVSGGHEINGQSPVYTYLDMMFRPEDYIRADVIYVKKKPMRAQLAGAIRRGAERADVPDLDARLESFERSGLISEMLLSLPEVSEVVDQWNRDLIRTAKFANMLETALAVKAPRFLVDRWRIVPPASGADTVPWSNMRDVLSAVEPVAQLHGMSADQQRRLVDKWQTLFSTWVDPDPQRTDEGRARAIESAAAVLAAEVAAVSPTSYPDRTRLGWESWYFRAYNLTWIWVFYAIAIIPLLLHVVFRWSAARWIGLGMFVFAFGWHTFALGLRWYVAQRWPNTNMFEAVTTSVWFGGCAALVLEHIVRRRAMASLFALGSAAASMVALMCAYYLPLSLDAGIDNRMPVLHDVWLYIHTNVIIFSYCLIFMAAVSAALYALYRVFGRFGGFGGPDAFARVGGAGSLIVGNSDRGGGMPARGAIGPVLDGTTMILMELSFIMLWAGIVMGAIWADHSWGRPWGWDPKEVFALNTFIVFAVLIHVRLTARDKGMWTAVIAMIGAAVMLFNWIAINFVITGLHSYA
jgi:cytochrome c-type biogenesis protein CcsB